MAKITVEVAEGLTQWAHGDSNTVLDSGQTHEVDVTDNTDLASAIAAAEAAGSLRVLEGHTPARAVENDDVSLKSYEKAQQARAELYPERDRALNAVQQEHADSDPETRQRAFEQAAEAWEGKLAEAAQAALEGTS